jgi:protein-tyrosine phosphatase
MLTEILSGLWIGNINDAYNEDFYKDNQISIAINCTFNQGFLDIPNIKKIRIPLSDKLEPNRDIRLLKENINNIIDFIEEKLEENNIIIYCYNGLTVSALIVAIYMIKKGDISKDIVRDILSSKNKDICLDFDLSIF